jgi:hypothetical protein
MHIKNFPPEIHISHIIMYIHLKYLKINTKCFVYEHLCKVCLNFAILYEKKLFLESELRLTLTQNFGWWPHTFFMVLNWGYLNAHSVKKWKFCNYNELTSR